MRPLSFLLAGAITAAPIAARCTGADIWQIDPAHSTARFTLASSNGATRPFDLAIAMVGGSLDLDPGALPHSAADLTIYPAGEASRLLTREGGLRTGTLASLPNYSVLSFQSTRDFIAPDGKLAIAGILTLVHVQRKVDLDWSNSYTGPVYEDPMETHVSGEATFYFDKAAFIPANELGTNADLISGITVIERANFPGFWTSLRESEWPNVVLDEVCHTPYYVGPGLKDYKGATCTGKEVSVAPREAPSLTPPGLEAIGSVVSVPPTGDQIVIHVRLQLGKAGSQSSWRSKN